MVTAGRLSGHIGLAERPKPEIGHTHTVAFKSLDLSFLFFYTILHMLHYIKEFHKNNIGKQCELIFLYFRFACLLEEYKIFLCEQLEYIIINFVFYSSH